ncbi:MAG: hypothetical protein IPG22_06580 [Acidobacteria bacterium]|nr:hypothetical protein [Acidobacteriota bacterium]MBK6587965.1 hypothetical protein [Acidobacteriota bacterium]
MTTPKEFRIVVRDAAGKSSIFKLQHEEVKDFAQAAALAQGEFPGGTVIVLVPPIERELEDQVA